MQYRFLLLNWSPIQWLPYTLEQELQELHLDHEVQPPRTCKFNKYLEGQALYFQISIEILTDIIALSYIFISQFFFSSIPAIEIIVI